VNENTFEIVQRHLFAPTTCLPNNRSDIQGLETEADLRPEKLHIALSFVSVAPCQTSIVAVQITHYFGGAIQPNSPSAPTHQPQ
jgi:hypothetical protein